MSGNIDLLGLVDLIYEAAVDLTAWPSAIVAMADALHAREVSLEIHDPVPSSRPIVLLPRSDPDYLSVYLQRWVGLNVIRERGVRLPAGATYRFETLMPRHEFERTPLYNELWRPRGIDYALMINAIKEGAAAAGFGFSRSSKDGPFESEQEDLLGALAPHLRKAVALNLRLSRLQMERTSTAKMLDHSPDGALLVDARARVLFANAVADEILRENAGLRVERGCLAAATHSKTVALRRLIASGACAEGEIVVLPNSDGGSLTATVLPLRAETMWHAQRPAAIVFIKDPRRRLPSREQLQRLFGLTAAQAGLAREILQGDGIPAAASRLGISDSTARSHLLEVFQKTGTTRQAELVRVILQMTFPGPRGSS